MLRGRADHRGRSGLAGGRGATNFGYEPHDTAHVVYVAPTSFPQGAPQDADERFGCPPLRSRSHHGRRHGHRDPGAHRTRQSAATLSTRIRHGGRRSPLATARLFATSARALMNMPPGEVAHVHLSERGSFLREGSLVALAHRRGLVTVATIHGASFMPFARSYPWLVSAVLRRADLVTCLDRKTLDCVRLSAPEVRSELCPIPSSSTPASRRRTRRTSWSCSRARSACARAPTSYSARGSSWLSDAHGHGV